MSNAVILLAAGRSTRMRGEVADKMSVPILGKPVFYYSLHAFITSDLMDVIIIVYRDEDQRLIFKQVLSNEFPKHERYVIWVQGGSERQISVNNALNQVPNGIQYVFIHDCARPMIQPKHIELLGKTVKKDKAVALAHHITDTVKHNDSNSNSLVQCKLTDVDRDSLWAMETPQVFERSLIKEAYKQVIANDLFVTDDVSAALIQGNLVSIIENFDPNPKITTPMDLQYIQFLLDNQPQS